ncbi:MAG: PaaI family thioesterase [Bacilli bacterium]|nr:PaaI family thioesterase [Bacilli bacterium]
MKVLKKQTNSKKCIVCGVETNVGIKASFYEMEDESVIALFSFKEIHQSYPERTHGGLITAVLDETIGRAIWITEPNAWGVTANLSVKFRKPVPYDVPLKCIGRITENKSRLFKGVGKLFTMGNELLAEAEAVYVKLPLTKICESDHDDVNIYVDDDIKEIN